MSTVISFMNQKGGVGKSTSSYALASILSKSTNRVLLIDLDSQASLTILSGIHDPDSIYYTVSDMLHDTIQEKTDRSTDFVKHIGQNLDLVPSNIQLSGIETMTVNAMSRENILSVSYPMGAL